MGSPDTEREGGGASWVLTSADSRMLGMSGEESCLTDTVTAEWLTHSHAPLTSHAITFAGISITLSAKIIVVEKLLTNQITVTATVFHIPSLALKVE